MQSSEHEHSGNDDIRWLAFRYVAAEMSPDDAAQFEERLALDQSAREAVAAAVEQAQAIAEVFASAATTVATAGANTTASSACVSNQPVAGLVRVRAGDIDPNSHEFGYKMAKTPLWKPRAGWVGAVATVAACLAWLLVSQFSVQQPVDDSLANRAGKSQPGQSAAPTPSPGNWTNRSLASIWAESSFLIDGQEEGSDSDGEIGDATADSHTGDSHTGDSHTGDSHKGASGDDSTEFAVPEWLLAAVSEQHGVGEDDPEPEQKIEKN